MIKGEGEVGRQQKTEIRQKTAPERETLGLAQAKRLTGKQRFSMTYVKTYVARYPCRIRHKQLHATRVA